MGNVMTWQFWLGMALGWWICLLFGKIIRWCDSHSDAEVKS